MVLFHHHYFYDYIIIVIEVGQMWHKNDAAIWQLPLFNMQKYLIKLEKWTLLKIRREDEQKALEITQPNTQKNPESANNGQVIIQLLSYYS